MRRTRFHNLPVYHVVLNGGNRPFTTICKVEGDIWVRWLYNSSVVYMAVILCRPYAENKSAIYFTWLITVISGVLAHCSVNSFASGSVDAWSHSIFSLYT